MEERTLEELNKEYVDLVKKVEEIKGELQAANAKKDAANTTYEEASSTYSEKDLAYKALLPVLEAAEKANYSETVIAAMRKQVEDAKAELDKAEATLNEKRTQQEQMAEAYGEIEQRAKTQNDRLGVIVQSFAGNEIVNQALRDEMEYEYQKLIDKKQAELAKTEELKTKISEDPEIKQGVGELTKLLEDFEKARVNATIDNPGELVKIASRIKVQRNAIKTQMRKLGLRTGKIEPDAIDDMTRLVDDKGRMVIRALDSKAEIQTAEITKVEAERDEAMSNLAASLAIGKDEKVEGYDEAKQEIERMTAELQDLGTQHGTKKAELEGIVKETKELMKELDGIKLAPEVAKKLAELQAQKTEIENEKVPLIENPKRVELQAQIDELKRQKNTAGSGQVETEAYKEAKKALEKAQRDLDYEKKHPSLSTFFSNKDDQIIDNPELLAAQTRLGLLENNYDSLLNTIIESDEELKRIDADYLSIEQEDDEIKARREELNRVDSDKVKDLYTNYVGEELYPDITDPETEQGKAFEEYKAAELEIRKAMLAIQKDPSEANLGRLAAAKSSLGEKTAALKTELTIANGTSFSPSTEAIHNYLTGVLEAEIIGDLDAEVDEAYNLKAADNAISVLASKSKRTDKEVISELRKSSNEIAKYLDAMLLGKTYDIDAFLEAVDMHDQNIRLFEDPEKAKAILVGSNEMLETENTSLFSLGFIKNLWSKLTMPKVQEEYDLPKNERPDVYDELAEQQAELRTLDERSNDLAERRAATDKAWTERINAVMSPEQKESMAKKEKEIREIRAKLNHLPKRINKTKLERLEAEVASATTKLNSTQQFEAAIDVGKIDTEITRLTGEMDKEPEQIIDPEKEADRKERLTKKQAEIDGLGATENPRVAEITARLEQLELDSTAGTAELAELQSRITTLSGNLELKQKAFAILELAKNKIKNLIHIKNPKFISNRNAKSVANQLAEHVKSDAKKQARGERE